MESGRFRLSSDELFDGAGLVDLFTGGFNVEVAVVLDRIAVCVQEGGVPVANGFVARGVRENSGAAERPGPEARNPRQNVRRFFRWEGIISLSK